MPEYLAPGVFVEEVSFRSKSIEGVGTSVCGMVGPTRFGPLRGTPEVVTSYGEYEKIFGDPGKLKFGSDWVLNHIALAARAFFENGGKQLYVTRILAGVNDTDAFGNGGSAVTASAAAANGKIRFDARFPGSGGNLDLQAVWLDQENLVRSRSYTKFSEIPEGAEGVLTIEGQNIPVDSFAGAVTHEGTKFPLKSLQVLAKRNGEKLDYLAATHGEVVNKDETAITKIDADDLGTGISAAKLAPFTFSFKHTIANPPADGKLAEDTPIELVLNSATNDLTRFTGFNLGANTIFRGKINAAGTLATVTIPVPGPDPDVTAAIPLAVFGAFSGAIKSLSLQRKFSLEVIRRKLTLVDPLGKPGIGEPIFRTGILSLTDTDENYIGKVLPRSPGKKLDALTLPVVCTVTGGATEAELFAGLYQLFELNPAELTPAASPLAAPRHIVAMGGGTDGDYPAAIDYAGETDEDGATGFTALEDVEDVSIVATPAAIINKDRHQAIVVELEKHCVKMRYRFGLVDVREDMSLSEMQLFRDNFDNSRLALYSPWIVASDPTGEKDSITIPPSGYMAGIYARTDVERGVHKAPANTTVLGALRFNQTINKFQQELLNPRGINCLRSFSGRGHRVWGGRTLSSDPEWKYVNVRRYFLYLERSIDKGTQWAVFEPNGEKLWANVVATVESFLFNEWKNGRVLGSKPAAAYFVRCDRTTITQNDIDNGRLVCEIGVAPLTPAEFVIFRIGQKTADA